MHDTILARISEIDDAYAGKTLAERIAGRFYTPDVLTLDLAVKLSDALEARAARGLLGVRCALATRSAVTAGFSSRFFGEAMSRPALRGRRC